MTVLVDTSVWAAYFNGEDLPATAELDRLLASGAGIAVIPIILTEVLQGFRSDEGFSGAEELLRQLPVCIPSIETHIQSQDAVTAEAWSPASTLAPTGVLC